MSGCTTNKASGNQGQNTPISPQNTFSTPVLETTTAVLSPVQANEANPKVNQTTTVAKPESPETIVTETTIFQKPGYAALASDPIVESVTLNKNAFVFILSDCMLKEAFPDIGNDPDYGIRAGYPPKIRALSPQEINVFLRDYTEGKNENAKTVGFTRCQGAPIDPTWSFIKISGKIIPRNAKPSIYQISFYAKALQKDILVSQSNETLRLEQPILFDIYIPLKTNEVDLFDSPTVQFTRMTNN